MSAIDQIRCNSSVLIALLRDGKYQKALFVSKGLMRGVIQLLG